MPLPGTATKTKIKSVCSPDEWLLPATLTPVFEGVHLPACPASFSFPAQLRITDQSNQLCTACTPSNSVHRPPEFGPPPAQVSSSCFKPSLLQTSMSPLTH